MLFSPCLLGCSRTCSRVLGLSLGTAALFAAGANTVLLFPNWDVSYLLRGLIGRHALLGSGLWAGGLMVLVAATLISMMGWRGCCFRKSAPCCSILTALLAAGLALVGALICFVTSGVALRDGPLCMFNILSYNQTQAWKYGYPFKDLRHTYELGTWICGLFRGTRRQADRCSCLNLPSAGITATPGSGPSLGVACVAFLAYSLTWPDFWDRNYLYDRSLWSSVCLEPSMAVVWHVSFFSVLLCISTLQLLLVAVHFINSFLGLFCSLCEE
ncbi:transmembrane 4 L6 family member 19 [Heterocephalus glaber]|uniref:Transmembrane 4 L6 family member 19 n=1 Tax=Heterocephalus glaber TaxID=10181 RepID=A0AAX6T3K2_HETGA|nr:transmembrane 4 L6 family member 19 [Heterocephalus glaber]